MQTPTLAPMQAAAPSTAGASAQYLAGGTTLVDFMKLDVMRPTHLIDITRIAAPQLRAIELSADGLSIGALASMREVADHPGVRCDYPVVEVALARGFAADSQYGARRWQRAAAHALCLLLRHQLALQQAHARCGMFSHGR